MPQQKSNPEPAKFVSPYFLDIETVPQYKTFDEAPEFIRKAFVKKFDQDKINTHQDIWLQKAALFAEFGKIVSISVGILTLTGVQGEYTLRIKNINNRDEKTLLLAFRQMIERATLLVAHNGKEFDFPYLNRRMIINGIKLPNQLNFNGKKTWELPLEDTVEIWSGCQWKHRASLDLLTQLLGHESPKGDMDGSKVGEVYYAESDQEANMQKIGHYNNGDVVAGAKVYLSLKQLEMRIVNVEYA